MDNVKRKKGRKKAVDSVDWNAAKNFYLHNDVSYQDVAERFGTTKSRVADHAKPGKNRKGWVLLKEELKDKINTKTEQEFIERQVKSNLENLNNVFLLTEDLIKKANTAVNELDEVQVKQKTTKKKVKYSNAKGRTNKPTQETVVEDVKIKLLKGNINTKRLKDLITVTEKAKNIFMSQPPDEEESGVILMPEAEILTPPNDEETNE